MTVGNVVLALLCAAIVLLPLWCHELARTWADPTGSRTGRADDQDRVRPSAGRT